MVCSVATRCARMEVKVVVVVVDYFPFALQACGAVTLRCRALVFSDSACNQELIISGHFPNTISGLLLMLYESCE